MTAELMLNDRASWHPQVQQWISQNQFEQAIQFYEQAIKADPTLKSNYWYLGLLWLLQQCKEEAQTTWLIGISDGEPEQIEQWTAELVQVLETEAEQQERDRPEIAWLIRRHIQEIQPESINNLFRLVLLIFRLERLSREELDSLDAIAILQSEQHQTVDAHLVLAALEAVLQTLPHDPIIINFTDACLPYICDTSTAIALLLQTAFKIAYSFRMRRLAAALLERALQLEPNHLDVLANLASFYQDGGDYEAGIETARSRYALVTNTAEQIFSSHLILRGLMSAGGYWKEALPALENHKHLLSSLTLDSLTTLKSGHTVRLFNSAYYLPYFSDNAQENRSLQNQLASLCQASVHQYAQAQVDRFKQSHLSRSSTQKRLKIGYLSHCLSQHSVGWLARSLFQYHDREQVELYGYFISYKPQDWLQDWYANQVDRAYKIGIDFSDNTYDIADQINRDEIDILVDLDSITLDIACEILALKPAPVQATWLGWDAPGLPNVDYFIADPYVLPDAAQDYYTEKIWRLPQTYIAIDGFEVGVPTLRRGQLDIPSDAIVYFSNQTGYKRHPDTIRLQLEILKQVPNSYFLVKGTANQASIAQLFTDLAKEVGVASDRLRFLPQVRSEMEHRANLAIADVVLDTFPYNGATTTLETLWMGIPMVTLVGEQFAARNSYTMMMNAGISEGIACSKEEYIKWGIQLGMNSTLRQEIHWKLMKSRQTAPLWNAQKFTRDMENAYTQMWKRYLAGA